MRQDEFDIGIPLQGAVNQKTSRRARDIKVELEHGIRYRRINPPAAYRGAAGVKVDGQLPAVDFIPYGLERVLAGYLPSDVLVHTARPSALSVSMAYSISLRLASGWLIGKLAKKPKRWG